MIPQQMIHTSQMQGFSGTAVEGQGKRKAGTGGFHSILNNILNGNAGISAVGNAVVLDKGTAAENKTGLIDFLRKFALSKGGSLEDMMVDEDALADLKKFLLGAGFDKNSIENIFKNLKLKAGGRDLKLSELFDGLKGLKKDAPMEEEGIFIEIAMVPHLESALSSLGLNSSEITEAFSGAKIEGVGIDIAALAENLKKIQMRHVQLGSSAFQDTNANGQKFLSNEDFGDIFSQLGLSDLTEKGKVSLDDFIKGLEGTVNRSSLDVSAVDTLNADIKKFFDKVKIDRNASIKSRSFSLNSEIFKSTMVKGSDGNSGIFQHLEEDGLLLDQGLKERVLNTDSFQNGTAASTFLSKNQKGGLSVLDNRSIFGTSADELQGGGKKIEDGSLSFENVLREINDPDKNIFSSKESVPQRNLPAYVLNQVGRQLFRSIQNGDNEVRFQIKPPQLGRLQMTIDNSPDGFKISIITEQNAAKDLLLSHANELKVAMMDQGIKIDAIDVNVSSDFNQAMADARQQEEGKKRRNRQEGENKEGLSSNGMLEGELATGPLWYKAGILDLVA